MTKLPGKAVKRKNVRSPPMRKIAREGSGAGNQEGDLGQILQSKISRRALTVVSGSYSDVTL